MPSNVRLVLEDKGETILTRECSAEKYHEMINHPSISKGVKPFATFSLKGFTDYLLDDSNWD